ncbi:MAG: hypothetical protein DYG99_03350 [Bacteroidetes bacterium CHB5]|nr:hypothetical protein [Bacteroidetes bacterium CHB5]
MDKIINPNVIADTFGKNGIAKRLVVAITKSPFPINHTETKITTTFSDGFMYHSAGWFLILINLITSFQQHLTSNQKRATSNWQRC